MLVKDIMIVPAVTVPVSSLLGDAIHIMNVHKLSALPVVSESGELCGILSESDLLHRTEIGTTFRSKGSLARLFHPADTPLHYRKENGRHISEVMSAPAITIDDTAPLEKVADLMDKHNIKLLPVLREGHLIGVISRFDLMRALQMFLSPSYEEQATSDDEIKDRILAEIALHRWADYCDFNVVVDNGQVLLRGVAGNADQKLSLSVAAENVTGVQTVTSEIVVLESAGIPGL